MKFGAELLPDDEIDKLSTFAKKLEENDFEFIWVADHFDNRNTFCVLSHLANITKEIKIGPGVTNPYVTHPAETASAIQTINELSDGRAVFGIGAGDKFTLNKIGLGWDKPLERIEEAIHLIKALTSGEKTNFSGKFFETNQAQLGFGSNLPNIPIYLGGQGPKMLKLAGEIADGALINASNPKDIEFGVKQIEKSNRNLRIAAHTSFSIGENREEARKEAKNVVSFIVASLPDSVLERHDISKELAKKISENIKSDDYKKSVSLVNERMVNKFSVSGNVNDCIKQIKELKKAGADDIVLGSPIGPNKLKSIEVVGKEIIPVFK